MITAMRGFIGNRIEAINNTDERKVNITFAVVLVVILLAATIVFTWGKFACGGFAFCEPTRGLRDVAVSVMNGVLVAGLLLGLVAFIRHFFNSIYGIRLGDGTELPGPDYDESIKVEGKVASVLSGPFYYLLFVLMSYFLMVWSILDCRAFAECLSDPIRHYVLCAAIASGFTGLLLFHLWEKRQARQQNCENGAQAH